MELLKNTLLAFIPIFVAVDAIGVLPIFASLTGDMAKTKISRIILQSMVTAMCLAIGFIFLGKAVFRILGITIGDFTIAGGAILFCIAISDILNPVKTRRIPTKELGAVPLGTPLIVGPAVLTTCLIVISEYGLLAAVISSVANILIAGLVFSSVGFLMKALGEPGSKALSKITSLLLAAIAVMMMRKGIIQFVQLL